MRFRKTYQTALFAGNGSILICSSSAKQKSIFFALRTRYFLMNTETSFNVIVTFWQKSTTDIVCHLHSCPLMESAPKKKMTRGIGSL